MKKKLLFVLPVILLLAGCGKENPVYEYRYVDLGLSVKWAQANVGASRIEGFGTYFAWGEIEGKQSYSDETYKWYDEYGMLTKYCTYETRGKVDDKTVLEGEDDAATQAWGSDWRTPTVEEFNELLTECTWEWSEVGGVHGYKVTSNVEGYTDKFIFLPANGNRMEDDPAITGYEGYYWTATNSGGSNCSYSKSAVIKVSAKYLNDEPRTMGAAVRPVHK